MDTKQLNKRVPGRHTRNTKSDSAAAIQGTPTLQIENVHKF